MGHTLITNSIGYVDGIDKEIRTLKEKGLKYFFRIGQKLHKNVLSAVKEYCQKNNYRCEINPCTKVVNSYEIIIFFEESFDK